MSQSVWKGIAGASVLAALGALAAPASAQTSEVKEKPAMYTYESWWVIPRARWGDVAKDNASSNKILAPALADGTLLGYGDDETLVHTADGPTHDNWWQARSMAALLKVLDAFYKSGNTASPVLVSSTKHWDGVYVSRFYNWKAGSWKGAYGRASNWKLKADAPSGAVELLSKNLFVPLLEKLLADGSIVEYEIDEETIHTESPDSFFVYILAPTAEGLDKFNQAVQESLKNSPMLSTAFAAMIDFAPHRDQLLRANATYK